MITYHPETNVLEAARQRISYIFDNFERIIVSISGGKDSTVLAHLALVEAHKRGRKIGLFYLDEEVVYQATIEQVEYLMSLYPENTMRYWFQIEFNLTNSVSLTDGQVHCWDPAKKPLWMHKRSKNNILAAPWSHKTVIADKNKGFGYYDVITNFEMNMPNTAHLVGLRAVESPNRFRAVTRNPGFKDIMWSTKAPCGGVSFYPLYDWNYMDIWKYIGDNNIRYHRYYDFCALKGIHPAQMRVSSLTHEKAYKSIASLPEFEPETYEKLLKRIKGVSFAQETAKNKKMFLAQKLPKGH